MERIVTPRRLDELLAAYGADPRRWPDSERAGAQALLARSPDLAAQLESARRLDGALDVLNGDVPAAVAARVAARIERDVMDLQLGEGSVPSWGAMLWSATAATRLRAAAFAGVMMVGIIAGASSDPSLSDTDGAFDGISATSVMGEFASWSE